MGTDTFITTLAAWATVGSAVATAISAVVIAYQAKLTRESVGASREAVVVAQRSLEESQIARLDAGAPRLLVSALVVPQTIRYKEGTPGPEFKGLRSLPVTDGQIFKMPLHKDYEFSAIVTVTVENEGPNSVELSFSPSVSSMDFALARSLNLRSGRSMEVTYAVRKSLAEWIADYHLDENAQRHQLTIDYQGTRDADVQERHVVHTRILMVSPIPNQDGDWGVLSGHIMHASCEVLPATRTYWKSRTRGRKFDTVL